MFLTNKLNLKYILYYSFIPCIFNCSTVCNLASILIIMRWSFRALLETSQRKFVINQNCVWVLPQLNVLVVCLALLMH